MKLIDLIDYLMDLKKLEGLFANLGLNLESEALLICMKDKLDIDSDVEIFEIEDTSGDIVFEKHGIRYITLFSAYHAAELIEDDLDLKGRGYSNSAIAQRLLEYAINDA